LSGKNASPKPENQFEKAKRMIQCALAHGAVSAVEMQERAKEQGISVKTLNRAKEALGVVSVKLGGKWFWQIPITVEYEDSQGGQGGQPSSVTALTILPSVGASA